MGATICPGKQAKTTPRYAIVRVYTARGRDSTFGRVYHVPSVADGFKLEPSTHLTESRSLNADNGNVSQQPAIHCDIPFSAENLAFQLAHSFATISALAFRLFSLTRTVIRCEFRIDPAMLGEPHVHDFTVLRRMTAEVGSSKWAVHRPTLTLTHLLLFQHTAPIKFVVFPINPTKPTAHFDMDIALENVVDGAQDFRIPAPRDYR
ncbi:uncharacterized protein MYCFIDRAFT_180688 [Pseudocercospora fijiensis CIRAD86]|uniref:Uncharacterized protein n=1 Tax=Pseudocercospora fijiensis (strain CIRAD86) TaxID=383855 RepID=M2YG57_PSEFD|nr:uncharacterized protein MYCFIDRAFT_180688 [Pseudocercospora fijiensis CIRAD86]EME76785.1 hypothetical protein MYCFIDRAFT_180688 [Pseudocercospora fijiensis CIRAD86]